MSSNYSVDKTDSNPNTIPEPTQVATDNDEVYDMLESEQNEEEDGVEHEEL